MGGWFGTGDNTELSEKYQTIITPKGTAFSIWGVIYFFQALFTVVQLLPGYRSKSMVQEGIGYWYCATCAIQACWQVVFGFEQITVALVLIIMIWLSLVGILYKQYYVKDACLCLSEYWLLKFPFSIHCGWITAASVLNVNVLAVKLDSQASCQLTIAIVSLAFLHAVSVWVCFGFARPNLAVAGVLIWANRWIYAQLDDPMEKIQTLFGETIIDAVRDAMFHHRGTNRRPSSIDFRLSIVSREQTCNTSR